MRCEVEKRWGGREMWRALRRYSGYTPKFNVRLLPMQTPVLCVVGMGSGIEGQ